MGFGRRVEIIRIEPRRRALDDAIDEGRGLLRGHNLANRSRPDPDVIAGVDQPLRAAATAMKGFSIQL